MGGAPLAALRPKVKRYRPAAKGWKKSGGPQKGLAGKPCEAGTLHRIIALRHLPSTRISESLCRPISLWSCASFTLIVREKGRRWASVPSTLQPPITGRPSSPSGPTFSATLQSDFSTFWAASAASPSRRAPIADFHHVISRHLNDAGDDLPTQGENVVSASPLPPASPEITIKSIVIDFGAFFFLLLRVIPFGGALQCHAALGNHQIKAKVNRPLLPFIYTAHLITGEIH